MKIIIVPLALVFAQSTSNAFVSKPFGGGTTSSRLTASTFLNVAKEPTVEKPTGTSFLPEETVERCRNGSPIEKIKIAKDPVSAFVDVYEYARKIREGEMTWEEVERADLDTVRF